MVANLTSVLTNGTGSYATTAQEDNAVLETLVRAHKAGFADYGRAILYRTASDFDRGTCPSSCSAAECGRLQKLRGGLEYAAPD